MRLGNPNFAILPVVLVLALAGCGGDDEPAAGDSAAAGSAAAGFPAEVDHKYGTTRVTEPPERVVTLGYTDQDYVLAFGVRPIATREWFGEQPGATWPWAQDELGGAEPEVLPGDALNFEQVAALRPDLIVAVYSGLTESEYSKLTQLAPTIAQSGEFPDYATPWQEETRMVGAALGQAEKAETLIEDIEADFAEAREAHPEFAGTTALFAYQEENGQFGVYSSLDPRGRFLDALGFEAAEDIDELAGDQYYASLSGEQLRRMDRDVLVMIDLASVTASREKLLEDPLFRRLDVVRERRDVYPDEEAAAALSFSTPLSLPVAIDAIVPDLAEATAR